MQVRCIALWHTVIIEPGRLEPGDGDDRSNGLELHHFVLEGCGEDLLDKLLEG